MSRPLLTAKGNGTQAFTFPGISHRDNSAHQLLISPGTHCCWVDRGTMGWEVCPTLLHMSNSAPLPALPPTALSPLFVCHHELIMFNFSLATISQSRLMFTLPPYLHCHRQSNMINYCLATISQTRLTFTLPPVRHRWLLPCHQCLERLVPLSPMF